ncbi:hypothetical protein ACXZ1K_11630 [Pedobacter sp. PWIIR3]
MKNLILLVGVMLLSFSVRSQESSIKSLSTADSLSKINKKIIEMLDNLDKKDLDTTGINLALTNNFFYDVVFQNSSDKKILNRSIKWMSKLVKYTAYDQTNLDTYANLLYKAGKVKKAIEVEQHALELELKEAKLQGRKPDTSYDEIIKKMKLGIKTWK